MNLVSRLLSGDPTFFGGPQFSQEDTARARTEQIDGICRYTRPVMVGNVCSAIGFAAAALPTPDRLVALVWAGFIIFLASFHYLRATRPRRSDILVSARTVRRAVLNAFVLGAVWACLPTLFFASAPEPNKLFIISLCTGLACGGAFVLASLPVAAFAFMMPVVGATTLVLLREGGQLYRVISGLMFIYLFLLMRASVSHGIQTLHNLSDKYKAERTAATDPLTGLLNRTGLRSRFAEIAPEALKSVALYYLDLDGFKKINDELGHAAGDEVLVQFSERLRQTIRQGDTVARIGGDEFIILARNIDSPAVAERLANRILRKTSSPLTIAGRSVSAPTSIGIALAPQGETDFDALLRHADEALYEAKRAGIGTFKFSSPETAHESTRRDRLEEELGLALQNGQIFVEFQPIFSLHQGTLSAFEALVRWSHPELGRITPPVFIGLAEANGLIDQLGDCVLEQACAAAATWPSHIRLAVNWSPSQFQRDCAASRAVATLARHGISPHRLEIEVTEQVPLQSSSVQARIEADLAEAGITFSLDDFGTGYSSLTALRKLRFSRLKIDKAFVTDALADADCGRIVKGIIDFAHGLGLAVVAEGIEEPEQLEMLHALHCDEVQGFLLGRPVSAFEAARIAQEGAPSLISSEGQAA